MSTWDRRYLHDDTATALEDPRNFRGSFVWDRDRKPFQEDELLNRYHRPGLRAEMERQIDSYQYAQKRWLEFYGQQWDEMAQPSRRGPRPVDPSHPMLVALRRRYDAEQARKAAQAEADYAALWREHEEAIRHRNFLATRQWVAPGLIFYRTEAMPIRRHHLEAFLELACTREVVVNGDIIKVAA